MTEKENNTPWKRARVFISHNSQEKPIAIRISTILLQHGHEVWLDKWEMKPGDSLIAKISEGIVNSSYLLILLSKKSVSSPWVSKELETALHNQITQNNIKVIPCLIEDCEIPPFLQPIIYANFRDDFLTGMEDLLPAIQPIDLIKSGRIKEGEEAYVTDYAFDWQVEGNSLVYIRIECIDHYLLEGYTIRADYVFHPIGKVKDRIDSFAPEHLEMKISFLLRLIFEVFNTSEKNDLSLLLDGPYETNGNKIFISTKEEELFDFSFSARRLGQNVETLVRFDFGDPLKKYISTLSDDFRQAFTKEDFLKYF